METNKKISFYRTKNNKEKEIVILTYLKKKREPKDFNEGELRDLLRFFMNNKMYGVIKEIPVDLINEGYKRKIIFNNLLN